MGDGALKTNKRCPPSTPSKAPSPRGAKQTYVSVRKCSETSECKVYTKLGEEAAKFSWGWGWKENTIKQGTEGDI